MKKIFSLFSLLLSITFFWSCKPTTEKASVHEAAKPNFVVIYSDELQFDDLSCYGGKIPTPHLDQLAAEGMRFDKAYTTSSMCTPSRFALMTGTYPGRCKHPSFLDENPTNEPYSIAWNTWLQVETPTIPKLLRQHGYVTGMSGKWHIGEMPDSVQLPTFNRDDSLEDPGVDEKLKQQQRIYSEWVRKLGGFDVANSVVWGNYDGHRIRALHFHNFPWMTKGALYFLDEHAGKDQPFFLYLTPTAIHGPNHVQDLNKDCRFTPEGRMEEVLQYAVDTDSIKSMIEQSSSGSGHRFAGMAQIEHQLHLVREKLKEKGAADNTVIIFMADHNIEPGKATSFEKGIHVPMIVYAPDLTNGATSDALVQNIDIFPTLLEMAGIEMPDNVSLDGISFNSILSNPEADTREYIYAENGYTRAISSGSLKYIALRYPESLVEAMATGKIDYVPSYVKAWPQAHSAIAMHAFPHYFDQDQLYNLESDPYEVSNLVDDTDLASSKNELREALKNYLATFDHPYSLDQIPFMESVEYRKLAGKDLAWDLSNIPWLRRDHGPIVWPPK